MSTGKLYSSEQSFYHFNPKWEHGKDVGGGDFSPLPPF